MKKYLVGTVLSLGILASPLFASAAGLTSSQISAIIGLLQSFGADQTVISNVQVSLTGGTPASTISNQFCYNFSFDLSVGAGGSAVTALQTALQRDGMSVTASGSFDEQTASAVTGFQEKYASNVLAPVGLQHGTGYVGPSTRAKLNVLHGCGNNQQPVQPTQPVPPTNPSVSAPVITGIDSTGVITPGTKIVVNGYNFDSNSLIELDGNQMLGITPVSYSPTSLVFVLPSSWSVGTHSVRVVQMKTNNVASNVVSFMVTATQQTASTITVLSPNGGETWHPGETHRISWTPNAVNNVKIYIYDSGVFGSGSTNYITPNGNAASGLSGYYDWIIPSFGQLPPFNGLGSTNYKIRIDNADTNTVLDSSNASFSILATGAAASGLTSSQVQAILSLLATFNANSTTVANMTTVLNGGTLATTPPASSGLTNAQIQSVLSLLSSFGANSTTIANSTNVLGAASAMLPIATLSPSSSTIAPEGKVFLYFSSVNATSCTAPSGNWQTSGAIGGSYVTNPITSNTTFTLQCTGPGGTSPIESVTVMVASAAPTISSISPTSVTPGATVTVYGSNFDQYSQIELDDHLSSLGTPLIAPNTVPVSGASTLSFTVPASAHSGSYTVQIAENGKNIPYSNSVPLTVL